MRKYLWLGAAALTLLLGVGCFPVSHTHLAVTQGRVIAEDRSGIRGAIVRLWDIYDSSIEQTVITDAQGKFVIEPLTSSSWCPPGPCDPTPGGLRLGIAAPGYEPREMPIWGSAAAPDDLDDIVLTSIKKSARPEAN